jgi:competence protein ComFB
MDEPIIVKNLMEEIVKKKLFELIKSRDICKCERCLADIQAIVLNNLPPRYTVTGRGDALARFELLIAAQSNVDMIRELQAAIEKVSSHPRHTAP